MSTDIKEKGMLENFVVAEEVKIGVCEGNPCDGFVIAFKGKNPETDDVKEVSAIIPMDGMAELIQGLFTSGVRYQEETGTDIGFSSVIKEKKNEQ